MVTRSADHKAELGRSSKAAVAHRLGSVPLFRSCSKAEVKALAGVARIEPVATGAALTTEGTQGRTLYVLLQGAARVSRNGRKVADIGSGAVIGEMALLTRQPRNATVTVTEPSEVAAIDASSFDRLLKHSPTFTRRLLDSVAARVCEMDARAIH